MWSFLFLVLVTVCCGAPTSVSVQEEQTLATSLKAVLDKYTQELNRINLQLGHLTWDSIARPHQCAGTVSHKNMTKLDSNTIVVQIDASKCRFARTPIYFTSLGGTHGHLAATGLNAIYDPTPNGFTVKMRLPILTAEQILQTAADAKWVLNWNGVLEYEANA